MVRAFGAHCQFRTNALQQTAPSFNDLVSAAKQREREADSKRLGNLDVEPTVCNLVSEREDVTLDPNKVTCPACRERAKARSEQERAGS
jgi:hypothetical protein